jgi:hypothetical protein
VSKDSKSSFLRNFLLTSVFDEEIANLIDVSPNHKKEFSKILGTRLIGHRVLSTLSEN